MSPRNTSQDAGPRRSIRMMPGDIVQADWFANMNRVSANANDRHAILTRVERPFRP